MTITIHEASALAEILRAAERGLPVAYVLESGRVLYARAQYVGQLPALGEARDFEAEGRADIMTLALVVRGAEDCQLHAWPLRRLVQAYLSGRVVTDSVFPPRLRQPQPSRIAWRLITEDFRDQETDLPGGYYAQIGPEHPGGWSWTILRTNDEGYEEEIDGGTAKDEAAAKAAADNWRPCLVDARCSQLWPHTGRHDTERTS